MLDWQNGAVVLLAALWAWQYSRDATAAWISLPGLFFTVGNVFFRRVVLAHDRITLYEMALYGTSHRFERLINYSTTEHKGRVDIEVTLQQKGGQNIEIFGSEFNSGLRRAQGVAGSKERIVSFSVEPEQWNALLNYLRAHGAVVDEIAAMWTENHLAKRARLLKDRDDLTDEEAAELLREIEEQLMKSHKY